MSTLQRATFAPHIRPLISKEQIQSRIAELGAQITTDYRDQAPVLIGVMKGSMTFMADLKRHIDLPVTEEYLGLSSYGAGTVSSGEVRITLDVSHPLVGKDVIIVEDIIDTGLTMKFLRENLQARHPRSLSLCSLLDKPSRRKPGVEVQIDYRGFVIDDLFVVGYGLDYAGKYRHLPYIGVMEGEPK